MTNPLTETLGKLNLERCYTALEKISVKGIPGSKKRRDLIEEAITMINEDPGGALLDRYIGFKNYSSFGDQRHDNEYGRGPRHGRIVYRIGRTKDAQEDPTAPLGPDHIYFLEAFRDFECGVLESPPFEHDEDEDKLNLQQVLERYRSIVKKHQYVKTMIENAEDFEFHIKQQEKGVL